MKRALGPALLVLGIGVAGAVTSAAFQGPSRDNEGSTAAGRSSRYDELERTEDGDQVTTYRSTHDKQKAAVDSNDTPEFYSQQNGRSTSTDTSMNRSRAGQDDQGL